MLSEKDSKKGINLSIMKKAPATGQALRRMGMNNVNIDFNFKYPSKKERVIYTVTSVLKDEIRLFGKSVISAILVCVCFENGWILPQEHCITMIL